MVRKGMIYGGVTWNFKDVLVKLQIAFDNDDLKCKKAGIVRHMFNRLFFFVSTKLDYLLGVILRNLKTSDRFWARVWYQATKPCDQHSTMSVLAMSNRLFAVNWCTLSPEVRCKKIPNNWGDIDCHTHQS